MTHHHLQPAVNKALFFTLLIFFAVAANAQETYFKVYLSYPFAGTPRLIKNSMKDAGYDNSTTVGFTQDYPRSTHYPSGSLELGWQLKKNMSVSLEAGLEEAGEVHGYNTNKGGIEYNFINWFVQPKYNYHGKGAIWSVGPSVLFMKYRDPNNFPKEYDNSKILPGLGLGFATAAKKTKGFRMNFFTKLNIHPTFDAETLQYETGWGITTTYTFNTKINPTNLLVGFCFQF